MTKTRSAPRLYVHGVSAEEWCARYGLEAVSAPCSGCGAEKRTARPFVQGSLRGLGSEPCPCGDESEAPYCLVRDGGGLLDGDLTR